MAVPGHFTLFLQKMIPQVPSTNPAEADHIIRRSMALLRLCFKVSDYPRCVGEHNVVQMAPGRGSEY